MDVMPWSEFVEGDGWIIKVDLLVGGLLLAYKIFLYEVAILQSGFKENQAIICKK